MPPGFPPFWEGIDPAWDAYLWDNGGVHVNCTIIGHLFHLLTRGGKHAHSRTVVPAIGQRTAERLLFRCMSVNLVGQPTATFRDFRRAMLDACRELGVEDRVRTAVEQGFAAVGIPT